ncbi:hypothetical protein BGY98DRAFT_950687 [Russula aff. rugulosa BPL654]|nr:hypothetical protein BGY98DRAFT_950687 [Russula aff. rugulosa BPL654]
MTDSLSCHPRMCMLSELIVPLGAQRAVIEGGKWKRSEQDDEEELRHARTVCRECTELKRRIGTERAKFSSTGS